VNDRSRFSDQDAFWHDNWLLSSDSQRWVAEQTPLSSDEYQACLTELRAVFPSGWIETQVRQIWLGRGSIGEFSLRPPPNHRLSYHPVPILLSGTARGVGPLCEVIRLGRDLVTTNGLLRIQSLRRELLDFGQYHGRMFELEVLAAFQRAGISPLMLKSGPDLSIDVNGISLFVEIRHRGAMSGMAMAMRLHMGVAFREFGSLVLDLSKRTGPQNRKRT
jgi:hypothetical protein